MKLFFRIVCALFLLTGTLAQDLGFDLSDALDDDKPKATPAPPPKKKNDFELDLSDALGGDDAPPTKRPAVVPPKSGGGGAGSFGDDDLFDVSKGNYEPEGGKSGGRAMDPDHNSAVDQPQAEAGPGQIAGIASAIGVALLGAASSYFAYQKKKLCFKLQGGQDPESGTRQHTRSEPQVMTNLMQSS